MLSAPDMMDVIIIFLPNYLLICYKGEQTEPMQHTSCIAVLRIRDPNPAKTTFNDISVL